MVQDELGSSRFLHMNWKYANQPLAAMYFGVLPMVNVMDDVLSIPDFFSTTQAGAPAQAPRVQTAPARVETVRPPPKRILLVDDDTDLRQIFAELLARSGYRVDTAEDGEVGWKKLDTPGYAPDGYDLLITDNQMPNLTGIELIRRLRPGRPALPVILASGTAPAYDETLQPGVLLRKPFTYDQLLQTVNKLLNHSD
jgi:CheY-like chemotaxis protein